MKGLRNTHCWRHICYQMNMIWHYSHFNNYNAMSLCNLFQNAFTKLFILFFFEHMVPVLGAPFKVINTLPNSMAPANQFHFFALWIGVAAPALAGAPVQNSNKYHMKSLAKKACTRFIPYLKVGDFSLRCAKIC